MRPISVLPHLNAVSAAVPSIYLEQPARLYEAFLDRRMKYTCGLFAGADDSLDDAQEAYLRLIADELRLRGGERVLDVGCGWGSLTLFLPEQLGCQVVGVTPSRVQSGYIRRRAADASLAELVRVQTGPLEAVPGDGERSFDGVALVEMIGHVREHRELLQKAYRLVRGGGRLFLSASCCLSRDDQQEAGRQPGLHPPGSYGSTAIMPLSQLVSDVEDAGFSLTGLTDTTTHYGQTMDHWQHRVERNRVRMDTVLPGFADNLLRYFDRAQASWGHTTRHYSLTAIRSRMGSAELP